MTGRRRRLDPLYVCEEPATGLFDLPKPRAFSTPCPPSLDKLRACLTAFRQTVEFYSKGMFASTSGALAELSKP